MAVLICMVGHDYQRILDGVNCWRKRYPIETIYILYDRKKDKYGYASRRNAKDLERALSFAGSKPILIGYNPQSYPDVFSTLYSIIRFEVVDMERKVLIDTTSTTKEAYGAAVTCALMFSDVTLYIVPPAERGWYIPEPGMPEYEEWFNKVRSINGLEPQEIFLPGYRLENPKEDEEKIISLLLNHGGISDSIRSIIEWCNENPESAAVKNKYSRLIDSLVRKGLVKEVPQAKVKRVELTPFGKILALGLKYYKNRKEMHISKPIPIYKVPTSKDSSLHLEPESEDLVFKSEIDDIRIKFERKVANDIKHKAEYDLTI
ncbi:MAG: DUF6293 family protein [Candidatus Methanomethylicia archaeon]